MFMEEVLSLTLIFKQNWHFTCCSTGILQIANETAKLTPKFSAPWQCQAKRKMQYFSIVAYLSNLIRKLFTSMLLLTFIPTLIPKRNIFQICKGELQRYAAFLQVSTCCTYNVHAIIICLNSIVINCIAYLQLPTTRRDSLIGIGIRWAKEFS